jgi:hypothetical protein
MTLITMSINFKLQSSVEASILLFCVQDCRSQYYSSISSPGCVGGGRRLVSFIERDSPGTCFKLSALVLLMNKQHLMEPRMIAALNDNWPIRKAKIDFVEIAPYLYIDIGYF